VRALVVADTHLGAGRGHRLLDRLGPALQEADVILHAGDIVHPSVLDDLAEHAPVHAVRGNNDRWSGIDLPERLVIRLGGREVAMVHDSGASAGRAGRLRRWFPTADAVVFGHSHLPWHETDVAPSGHVQHHLNPGSAMQRRRAPRCTAAWLVLAPAPTPVTACHLPLPDREPVYVQREQR